jgi:hypothetical protein
MNLKDMEGIGLHLFEVQAGNSLGGLRRFAKNPLGMPRTASKIRKTHI